MGITDGAISRRGGTRMGALLCLGATFCIAVVAIALTVPSGAGAKTALRGNAFRFPATKVDGHLVTFRLKGIEPAGIRRAYVKHGGKKRRLPLHRARAAARSGALHLHMSGVRAWHINRHTRVAGQRYSRKRKKATLVIITQPPPPAPSPSPSPSPAPLPAPAPRPVVSWRAVGSLPLSDAAAKALVTPRAEIRPANAGANHYVPSASELAAFHSAAASFNPLQRYVSGGFTGTTDEILQWGAHKWGIPEEILRAVAVTESWWKQGGMGDRRDGVNAILYPAQSRIDADSVYETLGLMQVKWRPDGSLHPGTEPLRWKSTAFNVDYWGALVRYYYDGRCDWCGPGYGPGQAWESVGAHYSPSPWRNAGMLNYISTVRGHISNRTWERPGF
jgi:hypothetical protein